MRTGGLYANLPGLSYHPQFCPIPYELDEKRNCGFRNASPRPFWREPGREGGGEVFSDNFGEGPKKGYL